MSKVSTLKKVKREKKYLERQFKLLLPGDKQKALSEILKKLLGQQCAGDEVTFDLCRLAHKHFPDEVWESLSFETQVLINAVAVGLIRPHL